MLKIKFAFTFFLVINFSNIIAQSFVSTYAGSATPGLINGAASASRFFNPFGMCIDKNRNLYIADSENHCIRKINLDSGTVSTLAGDGLAGYRNGTVDSARFNSPSDVCVDDSGNVYVSDFQNQRIRKISNGMVSTIAGNVAGYLDGASNVARFNYPRGICIDKNYNLYIGDSWNHRIRKIDPAGNVSTYAGGGSAMGVGSVGSLVDAADTTARFYTPSGLTIDEAGNIFVADAYNHRIRMIDTSRIVFSIAGSGNTGPGNGGYQNGFWSSSKLNTPTELFIDTNTHTLYISDTFNNRIRLVSLPTGYVTTFAGNGNAAFVNDFDTLASFNYPRGIVKDSIRVYVADYNNNSIRLIHPLITPYVKEMNDNIFIDVFPNPSENRIVISSPELIKKYRIQNISQQQIFSTEIPDQYHVDIDVSFLPSGIYFITLEFDSGITSTKKIIRQ